MPTIPEAFAIAVGHHQAGRLPAAEQIYRQILQMDPHHADTIHLLGVMAHQVGRHEEAAGYIVRAIQLKGNVAEFYRNLAKVYYALRRLPASIACFRRVVELEPNLAESHRNLGNALVEQGTLNEAIDSYQRAIELNPGFAAAHDNLGVAFKRQGKLAQAVACHRQAVKLNPSLPLAHLNLAIALHDQGFVDEAIASFHRVLKLKPDSVEALLNLGLALKDQGMPEEAIAAYRRALEINPGFASAHNNLGRAFRDQGRLTEAIACYRRAVELSPGAFEPLVNLADALANHGMAEESIACARRALALKPDSFEAHNNLGLAFANQGRHDEAAAWCRRALELRPGSADAHRNLGVALANLGKLDEAAASFRRALELAPASADLERNLGNVLKDAGRLDEAIVHFRRGLDLDPRHAEIHSNLINTLQYHPGYDSAALRAECGCWNRQFVVPLRASLQPHLNNRSPNRGLRLGYLSPDFCNHVAGRNVLPILEQHDHARFRIYCYASGVQRDALTERYEKAADVWRNIAGLSDQAVEEIIRADSIDILLDLSLHTAGHRLTLFARKPAPVQVSWAGYPGDTGLETIDYHFTDPYLDPPAAAEAAQDGGPDQAIRLPDSLSCSSVQPPACSRAFPLPDSFWCFDPLTGSPPVNPLPALRAGRVTFGSLNNFCKVNADVIALWSRVLRAVEGSGLLLMSKEGSHRETAVKEFARHGVTADRIEWFTRAARPEYLAASHRIDLGLDPFPYNGHTTSLDAFWMGVPVVTLVGNTIVGRGGLSQAANLGLPELIAHHPDQYVQIASTLARDLPRLSALRSTLRDRMLASPLMDASRFTRNLEAAYRQMWQRWCAK